ncbi:hypothetical protein BpHYR1_009223 [Brachionus plicatilis]|uniref:Uncharacterized protein n=1 Tax=Brachionus plicatilis TaxID=10195 RepID=A0A3M7Q5P5_BRAPC|nr:hypothetical protein BpHYR1_009223 [Brachionus plicatilis]
MMNFCPICIFSYQILRFRRTYLKKFVPSKSDFSTALFNATNIKKLRKFKFSKKSSKILYFRLFFGRFTFHFLLVSFSLVVTGILLKSLICLNNVILNDLVVNKNKKFSDKNLSTGGKI